MIERVRKSGRHARIARPDQAQTERGPRWLIFIGSAAILLLWICAIAVTGSLALGGSALAIVRAEQIERDVTVQAPARVEQGSEFVIEVLVGIPSSDELLLGSLDVAETYLAGVSLARGDPPSATRFEYLASRATSSDIQSRSAKCWGSSCRQRFLRPVITGARLTSV